MGRLNKKYFMHRTSRAFGKSPSLSHLSFNLLTYCFKNANPICNSCFYKLICDDLTGFLSLIQVVHLQLSYSLVPRTHYSLIVKINGETLSKNHKSYSVKTKIDNTWFEKSLPGLIQGAVS